MRKQNEKKEFCIPKGDYYTFYLKSHMFRHLIVLHFHMICGLILHTSNCSKVSLSLSPHVSYRLSLTHTSPYVPQQSLYLCYSHTHTSPYVPNLFSMCSPCVLLLYPFCLAAKSSCSYSSHMFLKFLSYTLPNVPGTLPRVPIHSQQGCSCSSYTSSSCSQQLLLLMEA